MTDLAAAITVSKSSIEGGYQPIRARGILMDAYLLATALNALNNNHVPLNLPAVVPEPDEVSMRVTTIAARASSMGGPFMTHDDIVRRRVAAQAHALIPGAPPMDAIPLNLGAQQGGPRGRARRLRTHARHNTPRRSPAPPPPAPRAGGNANSGGRGSFQRRQPQVAR